MNPARGQFLSQTNKNKRLFDALFFVGAVLLGLQITTQYLAGSFAYQKPLGVSFFHLYKPWSCIGWYIQWNRHYPYLFNVAMQCGAMATLFILATRFFLKWCLKGQPSLLRGFMAQRVGQP